MRRLTASLVLLVLFSGSVQAAEIHVLVATLIGPGLATLAANWSKQTGNTVVGAGGGGSVGKIEQAMATDNTGDLLLLPPSELAGMAAKLAPGSQKPVGHVVFALAVKTGAPHPDISTLEKFRAALQGKSVGYNDPASGSLAGKMVDAFLKQPAYVGVKGGPAKGLAGRAVADGTMEMAIATETELVGINGIDIVGPVPDATGLRIDLSGAVLANSAQPDAAASFLAYITRPESAAVWRPTGIAP